MSDTAFILGAGFSYASGIPLLSGFVERMWQYAIRKRAGETPLESSDIEIFNLAMQIRDELDGYHGRAMFDDRNIEDILSILSFNVLAGKKSDRDSLAAMSRAIARTIELSCTVKHSGIDPRNTRVIVDGPQVYRDFWAAIFASMKSGRKLPTIITFNYDLVLERSLLQTMIGTTFGRSNTLPFSNLRLLYHYAQIPGAQYSVRYSNFETHSDHGIKRTEGSVLEEIELDSSPAPAQLEILKLHGSMNFPKSRSKPKVANGSRSNITNPEQDPFILPPVFNKLSGDAPTPMWKIALERLRQAKNIVVVGYSLPQTDIYMQYFLKAALGPNLNLNRITVFDPALFSDTTAQREMQSRYEACFAPQLRGRIDFHPQLRPQYQSIIRQGTTEHFVDALTTNPDEILF